MPLNDHLARRTDAVPPDYEDEFYDSISDEDGDFQIWTIQLICWPAELFAGRDISFEDCKNTYLSFNPQCSYCQLRASEWCAHIVAAGRSTSPAWAVPPVPSWAPRLNIDQDEIELADISDDQKTKALGQLAPALNAYSDGGLYGEPNLYVLCDTLLRLVTPEVIECSFELDAEASETDFVYFSPDASTVRMELAALYARLNVGLEELRRLMRMDSTTS